jgi:hypothetical protein
MPVEIGRNGCLVLGLTVEGFLVDGLLVVGGPEGGTTQVSVSHRLVKLLKRQLLSVIQLLEAGGPSHSVTEAQLR